MQNQAPDLVYYEAWPVPKGQLVSPQQGGFGFNDVSSYAPEIGTCGQWKARGEIKFFLSNPGDIPAGSNATKVGIGDLAKDKGTKWKVWGNAMHKGRNGVESGSGPILAIEETPTPAWWKNTPVEGMATRWFHLKWDGTGKNKDAKPEEVMH